MYPLAAPLSQAHNHAHLFYVSSTYLKQSLEFQAPFTSPITARWHILSWPTFDIPAVLRRFNKLKRFSHTCVMAENIWSSKFLTQTVAAVLLTFILLNAVIVSLASLSKTVAHAGTMPHKLSFFMHGNCITHDCSQYSCDMFPCVCLCPKPSRYCSLLCLLSAEDPVTILHVWLLTKRLPVCLCTLFYFRNCDDDLSWHILKNAIESLARGSCDSLS